MICDALMAFHVYLQLGCDDSVSQKVRSNV